MSGARPLAVVNPAAGKGHGRRLAATLEASFAAAGLACDVVTTEGPGDATALARRGVLEGRRLVIAAGGDGTASEVAGGLVGGDAALGLFPLGSGNDFARALGYPRRIELLPAFLAGARERTIDVGEVNGQLFLNAAGVGIDGHVAARVEASARVVGRTAGYFVGSLASIVLYRPQPMRVTFDDGELVEGRHLVVVASNGTHFGGGMHVAPQALLDDGLLDVTLGGDLGPLASVQALVRLYRGTHLNGTTIRARRAREVRVELERPLPIEHDGEVGRARELMLRVRPAALRVLGA